MHQQMDVTGGLNTGGAQTEPPLQQQQPSAPPAQGINEPPQAPQRPPVPQQSGQPWQSPLETAYDPRLYQQAIDHAMAAQAAMEAELQQAFPPVPDQGFDPYYELYQDQYYEPYYHPRGGSPHEDMWSYQGSPPDPDVGDYPAPFPQSGVQYEEAVADLQGMVGSMIAESLRETEAQRHALDVFFGDYPALEGARNEISQLVSRGVAMEEILRMLVALNPSGSTRQGPPSPEHRRQLRNETFVETGAADPYVDPISQDDDRMIKAAAKHLFSG